MAIVELKDVAKRYDSMPGKKDGEHANAVEDFNLITKDGEFVVLVGPSGCGKSTTMRMIAGLEHNTAGEIRINGQDVSNVEPRDRDIAMVFQSYALYPHMSVYHNMAFALELKKTPKDEVKRRVHEAAKILDIEHLLDRKPRALSGGQRQRVALGRALVRQPQVFLMDEPLSNLDARLRVEMRAEITRLHRRLGVTTFYVTHDQTEAMTMGQRIVVMRDGRIQQIDTPYNLYERPVNRFVAGFIGTPSMNFLKADHQGGTLKGEGFSCTLNPHQQSALGDSAQRSQCWLGIRPEHLHRADEVSGSGRLEGSVEVVEPLGPVTMAQVRVGETLVTAQLAAHLDVQIGDTLALAFDPDHVHLFDADSDKALGLETDPAASSVQATA
ncbi:ABC transporter ATP-binding protein [Kushneria marisflavi]|uniref:Glycerol-3-phosphate ABC transporter ATP-binding protein n=1 Tax=Kushneria marisflavi TaxID=157779 RepID=A0A240URI3_9GAMM|nr:ABC transporter ATP-binding protein [Kushneria marisflavi]ART63652.1 glycerol-3-phosphate ABC transporter ATP-binding protein [Kushneria marisflavi]RKD85324.1 carbohydrate ABC transporter ATP-binding protein (CUT1 family) [Kushneria marisflavi]